MRVSFLIKQRHAVWQKNYISFLLPFFILLTSVVSILVVQITPVSAATSNTLNFQGRLLTNTGGLVADGSYNIEFKLYSSATIDGGETLVQGACQTNPGPIADEDCLWSETRSGVDTVTVSNGYFSAYLGSVTAFPSTINWDQELWLGMNIGGVGTPTWDGEMTPRFKLTAVPYAFRAGAVTDSAGTAYTGDDLIQKSPATIQAVNSALAAIRLNQAGAGTLLQLQGNGTDVFTVDKTGLATASGGVTLGSNSGTTAGTLRWTGTDFEGYDGLSWVSLTSGGGGGSDTTDANFVTSVANLPGTATGTATGLLTFTTATAVSNVAGSNTFVAPADGSFRACLVVGNANRTAGTATLRWRVNGVSVGAGTCVVNATNTRTSSAVADSGVVTFTAGDTIGVVFDTVGLTPTTTEYTVYWSVDYNSAAAATNAFIQNGNAFAGTATLGTTDNFGLDIITNGSSALSITSGGDATFAQSVTVNAGGLVLNGGIDNNSDGIVEAGTISGITSLSGTSGLTVSSGGAGDLTLDSASNVLLIADATVRRAAAGTTVIDLLDASAGTLLSIQNSDGSQVAGLSVEGDITALNFIGSGTNLTALDAAAITTGTLADSRLSSNVVLLNQSQTFSGIPTFGAGLILGNSTSTTAGALRWSGTDFEGYDGLQWVSFTTGGGGGPSSTSPALTTINKTADEIVNGSTALQDDNHLFFTVGANETWSYRFVVQANSPVAAGIKFAVTAPSGATCQVAFIDQQTAASESGIGCGTASTTMTGTAGNEVYEIVGTIVNGANAGDVKLQWAQTNSVGSNTTVLAGSYLTASINGGGQVFLRNGNEFGGTGILGTKDAYALNLIAGNATALSLATNGDATFTGEILANGGLTVGNVAGDNFSIVSDSVTLTNGLNFDSNTLVIDSGNNRVGLGTATPNNLFSINDAATADATTQALIFSNGVGNKGLVIQGIASQSANLFEIQDNSGVTLAGFSSSGGLVLGQSTLSSTATVSRSISLPDASGTICLSSSSLCGYIQFASGSFQTDATTSNTIAINKTGASGNIVALQKNGSAVFTVANSGALQIQSTDASALDIRNTGGTSFFSVDTSTGTVRVGPSTADATGVLFVLDTKNNTGDPTGIAGGQYYNSADGKFRCYENSVWKDCISTNQLRSFVDSTSDAVIDANTTNYWDTAAENNNATPNIVLSSASGKVVMGTVTMEITSTANTDSEVSARIERGVGSVPTCGSGTTVGGRPGVFTTNNTGVQSSTITFIDTPNTVSTVYYVLCSDSVTNGTTANVTRIRITLQEAVNTN